jgi:hypothetical protein
MGPSPLLTGQSPALGGRLLGRLVDPVGRRRGGQIGGHHDLLVEVKLADPQVAGVHVALGAGDRDALLGGGHEASFQRGFFGLLQF